MSPKWSPAGGLSSSTRIVMRIATTPSVKAFSRSGGTGELRRRRAVSSGRPADADLVAVRVGHRKRAHPVVRVRERGELRRVAGALDPRGVDALDVIGVEEAAARRPLAEQRADEVELAAVVLDDQVVPLLGGRAAAREAETVVELGRRFQVATGEERQRAQHRPTLTAALILGPAMMGGVSREPAGELTPRRDLGRGVAPGLTALICVTAAARALGTLLPSVGAPAIALVLGMAVRQRYVPAPAAQRLLSTASRVVLQAAIVVLGATFGLGEVVHVGRSSLAPMLGTLLAALLAAPLLGRLLNVHGNLRTLVGVGTAICGASAIGAVSTVIGATESEIAYAISTIFTFNVLAVLLFPAVGHLLSLGQHGFGVWAGTAINDTSSVVAAAYTYGHRAGDVAVVTKLARTTMIIPLVVVLAARRARATPGGRA